MSSSALNVIALISGGKDSLYSILHCQASGHKIIALANLHPPLQGSSNDTTEQKHGLDEEEDLNSFMYQTVGHSVIPLYEEALGIPLYRQAIRGSAIDTHRDYAPHAASATHEIVGTTGDEDETEALLPLLRNILEHHPEANAISTGAILSTYQRTRIESVALRLSIVPLSYLWQYPYLPPYDTSSLLRDLASVGQDARIVKVASGGLDESFLAQNVADPKTMARLERVMERFGGEGSVLGEGGEYETLAVDGPSTLWKKKLDVDMTGILNGEGGNALAKFATAELRDKDVSTLPEDLSALRIPPVFDEEFKAVLDMIACAPQATYESYLPWLDIAWRSSQAGNTLSLSNMLYLGPRINVADQLKHILSRLGAMLFSLSMSFSDIALTTILIRSMSTFESINHIYGKAFTNPLPPARITVACGELLPPNVEIILFIHINARPGQINTQRLSVIQETLDTETRMSFSSTATAAPTNDWPNHEFNQGKQDINQRPDASRRGLHVQSRSYWAPANIGPYSQAITTPLYSAPTPSSSSSNVEYDDLENAPPSSTGPSLVNIAGQIPLLPSSMTLSSSPQPLSAPSDVDESRDIFAYQAVLSLQHLFRIGRATNVSCFTSAVAVLADCHEADADRRVKVAMDAWRHIHKTAWKEQMREDEDEEEDANFDVWHATHGGRASYGMPGYGETAQKKKKDNRPLLPDYSHITTGSTSHFTEAKEEFGIPIPPVFAVQVSRLPRDADIEWVSTGIADSFVRINQYPISSSSDDVVHAITPTASAEVFLWAAVRSMAELGRVEEAMREMGGGGKLGGIWSLYVKQGSKWSAEWVRDRGASLVPCKRVWSGEGEVEGLVCARLCHN